MTIDGTGTVRGILGLSAKQLGSADAGSIRQLRLNDSERRRLLALSTPGTPGSHRRTVVEDYPAWRLSRTAAGQIAGFEFRHIQVLTVAADGIARIDAFQDKGLAEAFGLPEEPPG
jgi:hypothetical protein